MKTGPLPGFRRAAPRTGSSRGSAPLSSRGAGSRDGEGSSSAASTEVPRPMTSERRLMDGYGSLPGFRAAAPRTGSSWGSAPLSSRGAGSRDGEGSSSVRSRGGGKPGVSTEVRGPLPGFRRAAPRTGSSWGSAPLSSRGAGSRNGDGSSSAASTEVPRPMTSHRRLMDEDGSLPGFRAAEGMHGSPPSWGCSCGGARVPACAGTERHTAPSWGQQRETWVPACRECIPTFVGYRCAEGAMAASAARAASSSSSSYSARMREAR